LDAESGLQYNRARYLDSFTGKFISEDPISFQGGDSNLYRYVANNSLNSVDPSGLITFIIGGSPLFEQSNYDNKLGKLKANIEKYGRYPVEIFGRVPAGFEDKKSFRELFNLVSVACAFTGIFPKEPITLVAHSNGNLYLQPLINAIRNFETILDRSIQRTNLDSCSCEFRKGSDVRIDVLRLDPIGILNKPTNADFVYDVASNNPNLFPNPVDSFGYNIPRTDYRAEFGTTHIGLLEDERIIKAVSGYFQF
jgi:RHS repeat-associated protein